MQANDVRILAVKVTPPGTHPGHITHFKWLQNGAIGVCTRAEMVQFVRDNPGVAHTLVSSIRANLRVVEHWVETIADWTRVDNLLSLDRF